MLLTALSGIDISIHFLLVPLVETLILPSASSHMMKSIADTYLIL